MTQIPFDIIGFDLDGTLLDTSGDLAAAVNHALGLANLPPFPVARIRSFVGKGARVMLSRALAEAGAHSEELLARLLPELFEYYAANLARHTAPFPGLIAAMESLKAQGVKLAICTNKIERFTIPLIEELGLAPYFAAIVGGDTVGIGKPDPAPLQEMVKRAGGGRCAFVGDTTNDILGARNAGIPSIAVRFGFLDMPVEEMGADAIIDHFDELVPLLQHWPS